MDKRMSRRRRSFAAPPQAARSHNPPDQVAVAKPVPVSTPAPARVGRLNVIRREYRTDGSIKG